MNVSNAFVCIMGMSVVFIGLISLVFACKILGYICNFKKEEEPKVSAPVVNNAPANIENKGEIVAAVAAAIAEELGEDVSHIRILSFKKI